MKICILTTDTKHHTYFINKLAKDHEVTVVYELKRLEKPYPTGPFFEKEQDDFEDLFFSPEFGNVSRTIDDTVIVHTVDDVNNHPELLDGSDLAVSFGVGLLKKVVFNRCPLGTINVHRGIAKTYRGLDSDLWAIFNYDFDNIGVTLHYVDANLDTGDILNSASLVRSPDMDIYHLRFWTTMMATDMLLNILKDLKSVKPKRKKKAGRYYTAMGYVNKLTCAEIFEETK